MNIPGEEYHTQITDCVYDNGCIVYKSVIRLYNIWWAYVNEHMNEHKDCALYCSGWHGAMFISMVGGYGVFDGVFDTVDETLPLKVIIFGWDQLELDASIIDATNRGLVVVRTVRIIDNVVVDI